MRADTVSKIVLVAVAVVLIAATLFALAACNPASTVQAPDGGDTTTPGEPGITTPVNPGQDDEEQQPEQGEEGQEPGQDDEEQNPGQGDEGQGEGDEEIPEMSEAEYYEQNIELLKAAIVEDFKNDNNQYDMILDGETELVINAAVGEIFFTPRVIMPWGTTRTDFYYTAKLSENFLDKHQKEIFELLNNENFVVDFDFSYQNTLKRNLSTEVYAEFSNYLLKQNYAFGEESVSFGEGAKILDISTFRSGDAFGGKYIQFPVIDGDKIYMARLEAAMPPRCDDWGIGQIMGYSNNVFKVTEVKPFALFGVD